MSDVKFDFTEYKMSNAEKRQSILKGNKRIRYDFFVNEVRFFDNKEMEIRVDFANEYFYMKEYIDQYVAEEKTRREIHEEILSQEDIDDNENLRLEDLQDNEKVISELMQKYNIFTFNRDGEVNFFYEENPDIKRVPLNNVLSSTYIDLKYGEGILDFVYADFLTPAKRQLYISGVFDKLNKYGSIKEVTSEKIYNQNQIQVEEYCRYENTAITVNDIAYKSLYSAVCPPLFLTENDECKALKMYVNMLLYLQKEYLDLIEFCFDEDFYPEVLSNLSDIERYSMFKWIKNLSTSSRRKEVVSTNTIFVVPNAPKGIFPEHILKRAEQNYEIKDTHKQFAEKYGMSMEDLESFLKNPQQLSVRYEFRTVEEILDLEFTKMLEADMRFRKCKRCGKYFIMKGNYDTKYCDRVEKGQTRSCQDLAAQENYKAKTANNPALPIYRKYYKRYAARVRSRQIKEPDFKKWKFQALTKRDECSDGKITPEEYIAWMEDYFPNRKPKQ